MINTRLYRLALVPALLAFVVVMFSLEPVPDPLKPLAPPAEIDAGAALRLAASLEERAPERAPGSDADAAAADMVADGFETIEAGIGDRQSVEANVEGTAIETENVVLTLPGDAGRTIVVLAPRNAPEGRSSLPSSTATGALVELAELLAASRHDATYVLASTPGTPSDQLGVGELIDGLPSATPEAVLVLFSPAAAEPRGPFVLAASASAPSASAGLTATASAALEREAELEAGGQDVLSSLAGLALPAALGPQAGLIADGIDAVGISSYGGPSSQASISGEPSARTIAGVTQGVLATIEALDESTEPPEHGPPTYARAGDDLIPGWALSAFALALILPALLVALDAMFRANREDGELVAALAWAGSRAAPLLAALATALTCSLLGALPELRAPLPPAFGAGAGGVATVVAIIAATLVTAFLLGDWRRPRGVPRRSAIAASGVVCTLAGLALWLVNPYAALLAAPACHAWVVLGSGPDRPRRRAGAILAALAGTLPGTAALVAASSSELIGGGSPWWALAALGDGRLSVAVVLCACFGLGAQLAVVALSLAPREPSSTRPQPRTAAGWTDDLALERPSRPRRARYRPQAGQTPGGS